MMTLAHVITHSLFFAVIAVVLVALIMAAIVSYF